MKVDTRDFWGCDQCGARFVQPDQLPSRDDEYNHYLTHENDPGNAGYRKFLSRLVDPFKAKLAPGSMGLDYGCGPGPALAQMLQEAGHTLALYDPFFYPDAEVLSVTYDFITCTETAEHFHNAADEFERLDAMLNPGGLLGVMTSFQTHDALFADWHYAKDPTHVVFYRQATMFHIAARIGWSCEVPVKNVAIFRKTMRSSGC